MAHSRMLNVPLADHFRGYRHPFLSGVQYLGGVGGAFAQLTYISTR